MMNKLLLLSVLLIFCCCTNEDSSAVPKLNHTIEELMKRYKVSERTLRNWRETKGLPLREITPQNKWVYENELKKWETSF